MPLSFYGNTVEASIFLLKTFTFTEIIVLTFQMNICLHQSLHLSLPSWKQVQNMSCFPFIEPVSFPRWMLMALWKVKRILWRLLNYLVRFPRLQSTKATHTMMSFPWEGDDSQTMSICKMGHKVGGSEDKQSTLLLALWWLSLTSLVSNHYFSFL